MCVFTGKADQMALNLNKNGLFGLLLGMLTCTALNAQIAIELEKTNVMVAGVENPITVVSSDVPDSCLLLLPDLGKVYKTGKGHFWWGIGNDSLLRRITIQILDTCSGAVLAKKVYRMRELPVEILLGARHRSRQMGNGEFKAQYGLAAVIMGYDICGTCEMDGFEAHFYSKKESNAWMGHNSGGRFEGEVLKKQQAVLPGDQIVFKNIRYRCPGMKRSRISAAELVFEIK